MAPPHVIDLGPGYLDPSLLPVDLLARSYADSLAEYGSAALAYGDDRGALAPRAALADRVRQADGVPCDPANVLVTAGTSHALHLIATTLAAPGDTVLVDQSCYDLGRRILVDCGLRLREIPGDASGMDPDALDAALTGSRERVAFLYLIPTFHNPTGLVVPLERRRALLAVARRHDTLIVEDDAYAGLRLDDASGPPALASLAAHRGVIRLCTFSKTLAPGLRLGWLLAEPSLVDRLAGHGLFRSGGCPNHTTSLAVATLLADGHYDRHLAWLRDRLRQRRDALVNTLAARLDDGFLLNRPAGGYFVWLRTRRPERDLLAAAEAAGVWIAAGSRFGGAVGRDVPDRLGRAAPSAVRLAYSLNDPGRLTQAAERLAAAWNAIPDHTRGSGP
ncbi:aminotransferase-like domain-containing protein [Microtetraspora malaysiensis]|uniref:PLP-dependent aminotransferase family protein n=1 Tax=Microtetraspora malaysiensis TaxID=161358 RepID=A0ABW6T1Z2_9ACTN